MADDEFVISIDDTEPKTAGAPKNDAVEDLKAQFDTVQKQAQAERDRAEAAERRAADALRETSRAREEVRSARSEVTDRELDTVLSGIAAAQAEAEAASRDFAAAAEEGNFAKQAEAQRKIARAEAKLQRLDEAKVDVEFRRSDAGRNRGDQDRSRADGRVTERQPPAGDPVEAFLSTRDSATQDWFRSHPDEARALVLEPNGRRAQKLMAAHNDAMSEGYREGSAKYFQHIESFAGLGSKEQANGATRSSSQRRQSPAVAPVSQTGTGNGSTGGVQVRLTQGEAIAATDGTHVWNAGNIHPETGKPIKRDDPLVGTPIGHREFAKRKRAMQQQGAYDKNPYVE